MCIGAVSTKVALATLHHVLASLCFVVSIGDVKYFVLDFQWQLFTFSSQFAVSMSEMAGVAFHALFLLNEMLTELRLE